jgi:GNAT superfamily N-acetyltransferase
MNDVEIRWARAEERGQILNFIERMGFNPRDAVTWDSLEMIAMCAWQGDRLIGAIPLEPRPLRVADGSTAWTMHETVVAMHSDHRGRGVGSAMQRAIFDSLPDEVQLVSVFREEPDSPAYRWYLKNGFTPAVHVDSWFYEDAPEDRVSGLHLFSPDDAGVPWDLIDDIWRDARRSGGGFVDQAQRTLRSWLPVHPYRERYSFTIAVERGCPGRPPGYALLGMGHMHSETKRCDILELLSTGGHEDCRSLLDMLIPYAFGCGCKSTRWPLADTDSNTQIARDFGFERRWGFDMLIRRSDSCSDREEWTDSGARNGPTHPSTSARLSSPKSDKNVCPTEDTGKQVRPCHPEEKNFCPTGDFSGGPSSFKNWRYAPIDYI